MNNLFKLRVQNNKVCVVYLATISGVSESYFIDEDQDQIACFTVELLKANGLDALINDDSFESYVRFTLINVVKYRKAWQIWKMV